jgi:hypothetical protein
MARVIELDQNLARVEGREALSLKIGYITKILRDELPYSKYGNPVRFFSFDSPDVAGYIEGRLAANHVSAKVKLTSQGRLTVYDADVLFEGDL